MCRVAGSLLGAPYNCPPAPYETAFLLDEHLRGRGVRYAIELVVSTPLPMTLPAAGPENSQFVAEALKDWASSYLPNRGYRLSTLTPALNTQRGVRKSGGFSLSYSVVTTTLLGKVRLTKPQGVESNRSTI
jgi:hypothetical protein